MIILSDIHGNLEALEAVLSDCATLGAQGPLVCLGDMVGYGADPEVVVRRVRAEGALAVLGNHELGVNAPAARSQFNPQAWQIVEWTRGRLSSDSLEWLRTLPRCLRLCGCRLAHGMPPHSVGRYLMQTEPGQVRAIMERLPEDVSFVGHTHLLRLVRLGPEGAYGDTPLRQGVRQLDPGARHLVNCGAVGQPRDGDPHAKYVLYDPMSRRLEVRYVPYDARAAAGKILAAGLPAVYAERLLESYS